MTDLQKEAAYQACEDENIARQSRPLSPEIRKLWSKAKRKSGRPKIGRGCTRVLVSIERDLLNEADSLARRQKVSRSELMSRGLRAVLAIAG